MSSNRRVVITGMGAITPLGHDVQTLWSNLIAGKSGIGPITLFDCAKFDCRIAGEVRDFDPVKFFKVPKDVCISPSPPQRARWPTLAFPR